MMRYLAIVAALAAGPALAEGPFAAGSTAKGWGLSGEEPARFSALVVDAVCALTGDCPADCGGGARQMVLIRDADGAMLLAAKNTQPAFTGATVDLAPYCNQVVVVDGLIVGDPAFSASRIYMVQSVTPEGDAETPTNRWTKLWREAHPGASEDPWFRQDERVTGQIAAEGYLGLGLEADKAFIEEWF